MIGFERKLCPYCYEPMLFSYIMFEKGETQKQKRQCKKCNRIYLAELRRDKYSGEVKVKLKRE